MLSVYNTIEALRAESGSKAKLAILTEQKDNNDLREFLRVTYEPGINFYISEVHPNLTNFRLMIPSKTFDASTLDDIFEILAKRKLTGNAARIWLSTLYNDIKEDWGKELINCLIRRDIKAGVSVTTINKVWPGLVTQVPYMRSLLEKHANFDVWPWDRGVYSQIKADGMFANISHHAVTGDVTIVSRNGSPFPLDQFGDIILDIQKRIPQGMQCHGELLMMHNGKILPREDGNGKFNSLLKDGELEPGYTPIYQVWDMIPISAAKPKNKYEVPYSERFNDLWILLGDTTPQTSSAVRLIEYNIVFSLADAYKHCRDAMLRGLEGTVIKHPDLIWEDSDGSPYQIKLKLEFEVDLLVLGTKPADKTSKNSSTFGSLLCGSRCGKLEVGVTGIKDKKRKEIYDDLDNWVGQMVITVRANGVMQPSEETDGLYSLFLPRFIEERLDKTEADDLEKILETEQAAIDTMYHVSN